MSARSILLLATSLLLPLRAASAAPPGEIGALSWLTGCWAGDLDGDLGEECWLHPAGGIMLGFNRTASEGDSAFEFLRIGPHPDGIAYYASPSGRSAVPFVLVEGGDGFAVFTNPEHDFPQRITYRRDGDGLSARVEAREGDEWKGFELVWRRSSLEGPER